jgi:hypothetical protein
MLESSWSTADICLLKAHEVSSSSHTPPS